MLRPIADALEDPTPPAPFRGLGQSAAVHISYDDLHLYAQGKLGRFRHFVIENHLHGCALCTSRVGQVRKLLPVDAIPLPFRFLPMTSPQDRRREPRISTDDIAQLQVIAPFSPERIAVRVLDVSKSGMQVRLDAAIDPGSTVKIRLKEAILFAEIRHCRQTSETEYRAGLLLHEVISGSEVVRIAFGVH